MIDLQAWDAWEGLRGWVCTAGIGRLSVGRLEMILQLQALEILSVQLWDLLLVRGRICCCIYLRWVEGGFLMHRNCVGLNASGNAIGGLHCTWLAYE